MAPKITISKETLADLYLNRKLSQPAIARLLGKSERTVRRLMKVYGIKGRDGRGQDNPNYKDGRRVGTNDYRRHKKKTCERCGSKKQLGVHHRNDDHFDNRPDNLITLCNSCHMSDTKRKWWAAKKAGLPMPKSNGPVGWYR